MTDSAVEVLREAWRAGRPIVPFLAAGISANSGFPLIAELRSYLLKVKFYIKYGVYRYVLGQDFNPDRVINVNDPENHLARYITDFGWPTPNQLNNDLYLFSMTALDRTHLASKPTSHGHLLSQQRKWIDWIARSSLPTHVNARGRTAYEDYKSVIGKHNNGAFRWGLGRFRLDTAVRYTALETLRLHDEGLAKLVQASVWNGNLLPRADWSALLMELTEGNLGLIDALFVQLGLRYAPSPSHILLAHLTRLLGIRLILTTNFDPYIERAMAKEGLEPRVLDIGRDESPPDPSVVAQALSIIKLHGSGFSYRVGERLDYELDDSTRSLIQRYVHEDALLLVVGFSGYERRMMQLLEHITLTSKSARTEHRHDRPKVIWMHWEDEASLPATVRDFESKVKSVEHGRDLPQAQQILKRERLWDAADFFLECYQQLTSTFPKSKAPYSVLMKRITSREDVAADLAASVSPFVLFVRASLLKRQDYTYFLTDVDNDSPSVLMSNFVQGKTGYNVIWIDLEEHHTVSGVVTEIIDKMRVYDPELPPLVLPIDDTFSSAIHFEKPTRFIHRALRRGRYILAFDYLEGFGREQTSHHGLPAKQYMSTQNRGTPTSRVDALCVFLEELIHTPYHDRPPEGSITEPISECDWYCCISCEEPMPRHVPSASGHKEIYLSIRNSITAFVKDRRWNSQPGHSRVACTVPAPYAPKQTQLSIVQVFKYLDTCLRKNGIHAELTIELGSPHVIAPINALIKSFFDFLRTNWSNELKKNGDWSKRIPSADTWFLVFAIFRRPRAYVGLLTLWNEYMPSGSQVTIKARRARLADVLRCLDAHGLLKAMDMKTASFWIPHYAHEWTYKILTEECRTRRILTLKNKTLKAWIKSPELFVGVARKLVFLIMTHSRISRYYYLNVFQRTHDVNSLFEYLYHRVSAIRYAKLLQTLMLIRASTDIDDLVSMLWNFEEGEDVESHSGFSDPLMRLGALRQKFLQSLLNVLQKQRDVILSSASADTWLGWINQLIFDQAYMVCLDQTTDQVSARFVDFHGIAIEPHVATAWLEQAIVENSLGMKTSKRQVVFFEVHRVGVELSWYLQDIRGHLLREKRAWRLCIHERLKLITRIVGAAIMEAKEAFSQNWCSGVQAANSELDANHKELLGAMNRAASDLATMIPETYSERVDVGAEAVRAFTTYMRAYKIARKVSIHLGDRAATSLVDIILYQHSSTSDVVDRIRLVFESLIDILCCQRHLFNSSIPKARIGARRIDRLISRFLRDTLTSARTMFRTHVQFPKLYRRVIGMQMDHAFERLRFQVELLEPWGYGRYSCDGQERDDTLQKDGICKKLSSEIERQRQKARGAPYIHIEEVPKWYCQFYTLHAQCLLWLEHFEDCHRTLDRAMSMLREEHPSHRFLLAIVYRLRAHVYLRSANSDVVFGDTSPRMMANARPQIASARGKLLLAEAAIKNAEILLRNGRRNISQWRRLFHADAQLQIEYLLLILVSNDEQQEKLKHVAVVHSHMMKGLEAVRGGWDCCLSPSQDEINESIRDRTEWIVRWLHIMVGGYLSLWLFSKRHGRGELSLHGGGGINTFLDFRDTINAQHDVDNELASPELFLRRWITLNRSAGLDRFVEKIRFDILSVLLNEVWVAAESGGTDEFFKRTGRCWLRQLALHLVEGWLARRSDRNTVIDDILATFRPGKGRKSAVS